RRRGSGERRWPDVHRGAGARLHPYRRVPGGHRDQGGRQAGGGRLRVHADGPRGRGAAAHDRVRVLSARHDRGPGGDPPSVPDRLSEAQVMIKRIVLLFTIWLSFVLAFEMSWV